MSFSCCFENILSSRCWARDNPEKPPWLERVSDSSSTRTWSCRKRGTWRPRIPRPIAVSQSLAGRTALLTLLPFSIRELAQHGIRYDGFDEYCFRGFLPRLYDKSLRPLTLYADYYQTYVERDVRQLIHIRDMTLFEKLLKLLAGRVGQILDFSSLAGDVGIDAKTVRNWLSILEASYILFKLPPYFENVGKRVIKSPKYYFTDVGLLSHLLGIRKASHVSRDPIVGSIFENLVVMECVKSRLNAGARPDLYFFRDSNGNEVDIIYQDGPDFTAIEVKSASTFSTSLLKRAQAVSKNRPGASNAYLIYSGEPISLRNGISALHFENTFSIFLE